METFISSWVVSTLSLLMVNVLCNPLANESPVEITYSELEALNISCYPSDTCHRNKTDFGLNLFTCDCDSSCSMYGTCCVDSEFRIHNNSPKAKSNLKCLRVYNSPGFEIFMVDTCKNDETLDNLCYSDPEETNDPFLIIPVTSNVTGITYKNYFCAVCNEDIDSEQLEFWDMQIWVNGTMFKNFSEPQFKFSETIDSWTVSEGESNETSTDVPITLKIQKSLHAEVKHCTVDLIESCSSNWTDEDTKLKCKDYMAIVLGFPNVRYKNPHCAICNFEKSSDLQCPEYRFTAVPASAFSPARPVGVENPFIRLFVLEDRQRRCEKNMVYDKFADKCRCNSKIYTQENGKCVHKI